MLELPTAVTQWLKDTRPIKASLVVGNNLGLLWANKCMLG